MQLKINKPGLTIEDASYGSLYVELDPFFEPGYNRISVNTKCYNFDDVAANGLESAEAITPKNWERFNPMKFDFELEASTNLEEWSLNKAIVDLTSIHNVPYEYMKYEADVYDLDPSTGEPILDSSTGLPILLHVKDELIKKDNGVYAL